MQRKFIAFLDILGFKQLIQNNPIDQVINLYKVVIEDAYNFVIGQVENNVKEYTSDGWPTLSLKSRIISDSIILWNENDSFEGFSGLLIAVRSMCAMALTHGIPLRGSIVLGELEELIIQSSGSSVVNSPILLGNGITKAFELEKKQQMMGCIISNEAIEHLDLLLQSMPGRSVELAFKEGKWLTQYNVPMKNGTEKYYCVNWISIAPKAFENDKIELIVKDAFSSHNKEIQSDNVQMKIINTSIFIKHCMTLTK